MRGAQGQRSTEERGRAGSEVGEEGFGGSLSLHAGDLNDADAEANTEYY